MDKEIKNNELLSDEELLDYIKFNILVPFATHQDPISKAELLFEEGTIADDEYGYDITIKRIFDLINTQKRLYAESVENEAKIEAIDNILIMGSDYEATGNKMDYRAALVSYKSDLLRAEQRARIK